jgi:hypothetical protein
MRFRAVAADPRDHAAVRAERDGIVNPIGQLQCPACGGWWLMSSSLARHREREIPAFRAWAQEANRRWEQTRQRPVIISVDEIHAAELRLVKA